MILAKVRMSWVVAILLILSANSFAQVATTTSAAGSHTNSHLQVDWTLGEVFTESFANGNIQMASGLNSINTIFIVTGDISAETTTVRIYPIPFKKEIFIESKADSGFEYLLYDISGRQIGAGSVDKSETSIDAAEFAPGAYLLLIRTNKETSFKPVKLIKQ